ncbi:MAG: hypothetical protein AVDCRST_MAG38-1336 [uncultured Solirubrobacteraceae bacterium]|uniref:Uncharacterized protein n=1 Tax=uncultured Solirubrobacteraceae bacterium TaxID=1162706 RepID=A0A6J4RE97_9ACTN|nr:MAG: hypothetical protein AVDCRST_MAG38-1336 [uncultured Solirubrobacteraceae bacterium]
MQSRRVPTWRQRVIHRATARRLGVVRSALSRAAPVARGAL